MVGERRFVYSDGVAGSSCLHPVLPTLPMSRSVTDIHTLTSVSDVNARKKNRDSGIEFSY